MKGARVTVDVVALPDLLAGVERVEIFANTNRIAIPRSSRLGTYIAVMRGVSSGRTVHRGPIDVGGAAAELRQLIAIVDGLKANPNLAPALRVLLDGHYLSIDAPKHDPGRDKQFELFVAARLALGGLAVELAEPDIVVDLYGTKLGIAAKRPRRADGLESAIQKGRRQIRKWKGPGFLALDASMYPLPKAIVLSVFLDKIEDAPRAAADRLQGIVYENLEVLYPKLMEEPERSGTYGMLFHLALPVMVDAERGFTAAVGEAWLAVPAKFRPFRGLVPLLRSLGTNARILGMAMSTPRSPSSEGGNTAA